MLGSGTRDARRTERYVDVLMAADERRVSGVPVDVELDPGIRLAARELRAGLNRVHPSFRFEESLAARLASGAERLSSGLPVEEEAPVPEPGTVEPFRSHSAGGTHAAAHAERPPAPSGRIRGGWPAAAFRRLPEIAAHPPRPLIVGGVGVASAAISIGAVYVAWRYTHSSSGRMGRAARTAHNRRTGAINGIPGVAS